MIRALRPLVAGVLALLAAVGVAGAASAVSRADVNDFTFESMTVDYYLDVDDDGRSTLKTVETFVAVFPEFDQNRGMRRAIPLDYQGAPTTVSVESVTDGEGDPRPYEVETDDEGFLLVTSAASDYVHGPQTYVFTYTQRNVTRFFENTNDDEFYWDTNGTGWLQPFGSVTARVHVSDRIAPALNGSAACYVGYEGATTVCDIRSENGADGVVFSATAGDLTAYQNMTVAVGFEPHTFVPRDDSYFASPVAILQVLSVVVAVIALIWAIVVRRTVLADGRGRPTIIAEYAPPEGLDLITAAILLGKTSRGTAAQIIDFAVRRRIRLVETENTGFFARGSTYLLELLDPGGLAGAAETKLAQALFGYDLQPGTGYLMSKKDMTLSQRVRSIVTNATTATKRDGLRKKGTARHAVLPTLLVITGATAAVVFGVILLDDAIGGIIPLVMFIPPAVCALLVFALVFRSPLTARGAEIRDHLKGLELYIRLAEADRLRMLQSPEGALRETVPATAQRGAGAPSAEPLKVVDIYEKLLPYAVLFSLEKRWAEELGKHYVDSSPEWYSGTHAFTASLFASSISSMSSTVSTSYSGSSSSSSSGGSGGGGSSGGGGGGGGGGGV